MGCVLSVCTLRSSGPHLGTVCHKSSVNFQSLHDWPCDPSQLLWKLHKEDSFAIILMTDLKCMEIRTCDLSNLQTACCLCEALHRSVQMTRCERVLVSFAAITSFSFSPHAGATLINTRKKTFFSLHYVLIVEIYLRLKVVNRCQHLIIPLMNISLCRGDKKTITTFTSVRILIFTFVSVTFVNKGNVTETCLSSGKLRKKLSPYVKPSTLNEII